MKRRGCHFWHAAWMASAFIIGAQAQTTTITYQGRLTDGGYPAEGRYDLSFELYDAETGGISLGTVTNTDTVVSNGLFTVLLDFGSFPFDGADVWLEIGAVTNAGGSFSILSPRQPITSTPYAIKAAGADAAGLTGSIPSSSIGDATITTRMLANGAVTTESLADGAITSSKLGTNSIGSAQLARRYLSGAVSYDEVSSLYRFAPTLEDHTVTFAVPFNTNPVITLTVETPHPELPGKGPLLITERSASGFSMRIPTAPVGVEITRTGLNSHRPTIRDVNGQPAVLGLGQIGFSIGLVYSRASDSVGSSWPSPVFITNGYLNGSSFDMAAGRPAITFINGSGGVSFVRAADANGASWPAAAQILSPGDVGGGGYRMAGQLVNDNPAVLVSNYGTDVYYLRADDNTGSSWGSATQVFTASNNIGSVALGIVGGRPAYAVVADNNVYFARANDADGASWPVATLAVAANDAYNLPSGDASLLDIGGKPAVGFVGQAGYASPDSTIFFAQSTDTNGIAWNAPQSVGATSSSRPTPIFAMIDGKPAVAFTQNRRLQFIQSSPSGPYFIFPNAIDLEPSDNACTLASVGGEPAIAFYGNQSFRFIRQGTPPPNSAVNWIAVEP